MTALQVQAYPEPIKNQWILSEERARLRFIAQQTIPISSERRSLRQWLNGEGQTYPTTLAIRTIPSPEHNEQVTNDSHKRNYTTTICNASPTRGGEIGNQHGKRPRLTPTGLLASSNLGYTIQEQLENSSPPIPTTTKCGESTATRSELCTQRGTSSRLLPKGLLVASNLGYTIRKRKDNPRPPPTNTKKR